MEKVIDRQLISLSFISRFIACTRNIILWYVAYIYIYIYIKVLFFLCIYIVHISQCWILPVCIFLVRKQEAGAIILEYIIKAVLIFFLFIWHVILKKITLLRWDVLDNIPNFTSHLSWRVYSNLCRPADKIKYNITLNALWKGEPVTESCMTIWWIPWMYR